MTKRSNPYVEDFIPQSKTHVGLKQFNNNEDRMQKVYEKTLHLLLKGAKKSSKEVLKVLDAVPSTRKNCMKQLVLNNDGSLGCSTVLESSKCWTVQQCVCGSPTAECLCSYCEEALCITCNRVCVRCNLVFCPKCSFQGSEGTEICVSCYG